MGKRKDNDTQVNSFANTELDVDKAKKELREQFRMLSDSIDAVKKARDVSEKDLRLRLKG